MNEYAVSVLLYKNTNDKQVFKMLLYIREASSKQEVFGIVFEEAKESYPDFSIYEILAITFLRDEFLDNEKKELIRLRAQNSRLIKRLKDHGLLEDPVDALNGDEQKLQ